MEFSTEERFNYQNMIDEAIETIRDANLELGPEDQAPDRELAEVVDPLRKLKASQAFFASELTVVPLGVQDFEARGLEPTPEITKWMANHRFYFVQIPVTLMPVDGWMFTKLECWIGFETPDGGKLPKAHDIFPESDWSEILKAKMHLNFGLDENLKFRAASQPAAAEDHEASDGPLADVQVSADAGIRMVAGPFDYTVRREVAISRGRENSEAFWRLNGHEYVANEDPYIAVVLRVPKNTREINATGALIAYNEFNFAGAGLSRWLGKLREKVRSFFMNDMPLENTAKWSSIIPTEGEKG